MDRNRATFEAFDGVELRLPGGHVINVPTLTIAEAVHLLRLRSRAFNELDVEAHEGFVKGAIERFQLARIPLGALGFEMEGAVEKTRALTVSQALEIVVLLHAACQLDGWKAQGEFLDRFPEAVGIQSPTPAEVFEMGHAFAQAFYQSIYGLAEDFLMRLRSSPRALAVMTPGAAPSTSSTSGSMT